MADIADIFSPDGALAARLPGFSYREAQQEMAALVAAALASGKHAAIEAGTGIGKTFAYLVPVLVSGRRAIISTGTRTLQDQIFARDLPLLGALLGRPVRIALLKGRGNYLCWHRIEAALHEGTRDAATLADLSAIAAWGRASERGDLTELEDLENDDGLRGAITSTVDNCLGSSCDFYDRCFVAAARRDAQAADVVIVNHHLLLADLALKDGGFGELLPGADAVIVDEAHQLPDVAQQFFGMSASTRELESLLRDLFSEARSAGVAGDIESAAGDLSRALLEVRRTAANVPAGRTPWAAAPASLRDELPEVRRALESLRDAVDGFADASAGLANCAQRCADAAARVRFIAAADPGDGLRWFDFSTGAVAAHWTPFDVGAALAARIEAQGGAWVFASATLAVADDFGHFLRRIGVDAPITRVLASPFDYERNARLFVPEALPDPSDESYVPELMSAVWPLDRCRRRRRVPVVHELPGAESSGSLARALRYAGPRARAGARLAQRAPERVPPRRQCDPARHQQLLAGRRRARPRAAARRYRQVAVREPRRSSRAGSHGRDPALRRRRVHGVPAAAGGACAEAGGRPFDSRLRRSRPRRARRPALAHSRLRALVSRQPAADARAR